MKYFIVLLAVGVVFAQQPFDTSFEDNQQEMEIQNVEDDDTRRPVVSINVQTLSSMVKNLVNIKLLSQPVMKLLHLSISSQNRFMTIKTINTTTFDSSSRELDRIVIGNGLTSSTSTILAYRPKYESDYHQTGLGAIYLNLDRLFPCTVNGLIVPICRRLTQEEDGFFKGRTITEAADGGNAMTIFGHSVKTYGFVFESCPYLNGIDGCLPTQFQMVITCFLPRSCL